MNTRIAQQMRNAARNESGNEASSTRLGDTAGTSGRTWRGLTQQLEVLRLQLRRGRNVLHGIT